MKIAMAAWPLVVCVHNCTYKQSARFQEGFNCSVTTHLSNLSSCMALLARVV